MSGYLDIQPAEDWEPYRHCNSVIGMDPDNDLAVNMSDCPGDKVPLHYICPPAAWVEYVAFRAAPDCIGVSCVMQTMVIELPETDSESFRKRLRSLPDYIPYSLRLFYYNGTVPNSQRDRRASEISTQPGTRPDPNPCAAVSVDDMACIGSNIQKAFMRDVDRPEPAASTAGILLEKNGQRCLTFSSQSCGEEPIIRMMFPDPATHLRLGQPRYCYGSKQTGTSDIGLATLTGADFINAFPSGAKPQKLVRITDCSVDDDYIIESAFIGQQPARGMDWRFVRRTAADGVPRLVLKQGILVITNEAMRRSPEVRAGVAGSVLRRTAKKLRDGVDEHGVEIGARLIDVSSEGEICGLLHHTDLQVIADNELASYLCYADIFDPLIDEGWTVAK